MNLHRHSKQRTLRMACFHLNLLCFYFPPKEQQVLSSKHIDDGGATHRDVVKEVCKQNRTRRLTARLTNKLKLKIDWGDWCTRDVGNFFNNGSKELDAWIEERVVKFTFTMEQIKSMGIDLNRHPSLDRKPVSGYWVDAKGEKHDLRSEHTDREITKAFLHGDGNVRRAELRMIDLYINKDATQPNAGK